MHIGQVSRCDEIFSPVGAVDDDHLHPQRNELMPSAMTRSERSETKLRTKPQMMINVTIRDQPKNAAGYQIII